MLNYQYHQIKNSYLTLIFLHGLGGNLTAWDQEVKKLNQLGLSTLTVDLPGHGQSPDTNNPDDYTLKASAEAIHLVTTTENIPQYVLVGHCYGGMVALMLAYLYPSTLTNLILIDTTYKPAFLNLEDTNKKFLAKTLSALAANFTDHPNTGSIRDWDLNRLSNEIRKTSLTSYLLSFKNSMTFDGSHILSTITCPVLIIHGQEDTVIPPEIATQMNHRLKNSTLDIIPGANHIIVLNNPKELTQTIFDFLKKTSPPEV